MSGMAFGQKEGKVLWENLVESKPLQLSSGKSINIVFFETPFVSSSGNSLVSYSYGYYGKNFSDLENYEANVKIFDKNGQMLSKVRGYYRNTYGSSYPADYRNKNYHTMYATVQQTGTVYRDSILFLDKDLKFQKGFDVRSGSTSLLNVEDGVFYSNPQNTLIKYDINAKEEWRFESKDAITIVNQKPPYLGLTSAGADRSPIVLFDKKGNKKGETSPQPLAYGFLNTFFVTNDSGFWLINSPDLTKARLIRFDSTGKELVNISLVSVLTTFSNVDFKYGLLPDNSLVLTYLDANYELNIVKIDEKGKTTTIRKDLGIKAEVEAYQATLTASCFIEDLKIAQNGAIKFNIYCKYVLKSDANITSSHVKVFGAEKFDDLKFGWSKTIKSSVQPPAVDILSENNVFQVTSSYYSGRNNNFKYGAISYYEVDGKLKWSDSDVGLNQFSRKGNQVYAYQTLPSSSSIISSLFVFDYDTGKMLWKKENITIYNVPYEPDIKIDKSGKTYLQFYSVDNSVSKLKFQVIKRDGTVSWQYNPSNYINAFEVADDGIIATTFEYTNSELKYFIRKISPCEDLKAISITGKTEACPTEKIKLSIPKQDGITYQWQKDGVDISGATSNNLNISNFNYTNIGGYKLKVTGTCGTITSGNIRINANYGDVVFAKLDYPAYTNSDILLTAFSGSSFGNASNAYRWAGPNGFTSTEQNPVIPNGTALNSGTYTVTATNAGGCVNYALLSVTVTTAPITLGNLGTTSFCPNGTLSVPFTTTLAIGTLYKVYLSDANGSFRNQTEIGNGMTSPIEVTFPQYGVYAGTKYRIRIVSTSPSATSSLSGYLSTDGQVLAISVKNLVGREIEPSNTIICNGSAFTGIINTNQMGVIYDWKRDGNFQTNDASLRMTQSGVYIASINKIGCNAISKTMNIVFSSSSFTATIRLGNEYQCAGTSIIFRNQYYSDSATYQWRKDGNIIIGETKDSLITNQNGSYRADVTDKCPVTYIPTFNEKVVFGDIIENKIYRFDLESSNTNIICGSNIYGLIIALSSVPNKNPLTPYSFQWLKNGQNIQDATRIISPNIKEAGIYSLALTQGNCTVLSEGVEFIKADTLRLKANIRKPFTETFCQGMQAFIDINTAYGINHKYYKDGVEFTPSAIYSPHGFYVNETGKYSVSGTASGCTIISTDSIKISVGDNVKPFISKRNLNLCYSGNSTISILSGILGSSTYQWFKNNLPVPLAVYQYLTTNQLGFYKVRVTNGSCSGFSDSVEVKPSNQLPKPKIYNYYDSESRSIITHCSNSLISLNTNGIAINYYNEVGYDSLFWKRNGLIIDKRYNNHIDLNITESGTYTVIGKQGTCETESDPVEIKIGEPITANITGATSIYPGQKAKLNLNFTGGNAWFYQTSDVATGQTTSLSPTLKNVNPSSTQTYSITSVASNCGVGTITGNATVTVLSCPTDKTISLNSGNWNTATTWTCGQIPTAAYDAIIENGHTVTLPNGYQGETKKLDLRGGLKQGVGAGVRVSN